MLAAAKKGMIVELQKGHYFFTVIRRLARSCTHKGLKQELALAEPLNVWLDEVGPLPVEKQKYADSSFASGSVTKI